jgi:hypothetical protein
VWCFSSFKSCLVFARQGFFAFPRARLDVSSFLNPEKPGMKGWVIGGLVAAVV